MQTFNLLSRKASQNLPVLVGSQAIFPCAGTLSVGRCSSAGRLIKIVATRSLPKLGFAALPFFVCFSVLSSKIGFTQEKSTPGYEYKFPAMGTLVYLKAYHGDREKVSDAFTRAEQRVREIEKTLTDYDPNSETSKLTERAVKNPTAVSADLWAVLQASDRWYHVSEGTFDSSLGTLTKLWRKYRRARRIPGEKQIDTSLAHTGWEHVELDKEEPQVTFAINDLHLDFGGIGKGYAVDEVFDLLAKDGIECCMVNISGNIRVGSQPPGREGWRIEVAGLERGGKPLQRMILNNAAMATSGDLWQYIEIEGRRHSHILDPKTGYGVLGPISATAVGKTAMEVDAMATVGCILDWKKTQALAEKEGIKLLVAKRGEAEKVSVKRTQSFPEPLPTEESKPTTQKDQ